MPRSRLGRADYRRFETFRVRWRDNDVYGHINNAVYYEYVDTTVNGWLVESGALDVPRGPVVCLVVETGCTFFDSLRFPGPIETGLRLERLGRSSIEYRIGLFGSGEDREAAAANFVHVCVSRDEHRPVPVPELLREALTELAV